MVDYEQLLDKAISELPEQTQGSDRFSVENVRGHIEGNKTVIVNLRSIAKTLERRPEHLLKYLLRELATPGKFERGRLVLGSKVSATKINKKVKKYMSEFVFCSECSSPDTKLVDERGITHLRCQACGTKKPVKTI